MRVDSLKPGHPVGRALAAAAVFAAVASAGLTLFPPLQLILLFVIGPAACAFFFAGRPADRETFMANGYATSFTAGLTGAIWLGIFADDSTEPAAVAVGSIVSFVLLTFFATAGCYIAGRWLEKRALAEARTPARYRDR